MALNKSRLTIGKTNRTDLSTNHPHMRLDDDGDSIRSYGEGPQQKQSVKYAWGPNDRVSYNHWYARGVEEQAAKPPHAWSTQVNHDTFIRMVDEHREAKRREAELELKGKQ
jgi:hypothetical protein